MINISHETRSLGGIHKTMEGTFFSKVGLCFRQLLAIERGIHDKGKLH